MSYPEVVPGSGLEAATHGHNGGHNAYHPQPGWGDHGEKDPKFAVIATAGAPVDYKSDHAPSVQYDSGLIPVQSMHSFKIDDTGNLVPPNGNGSRQRKTICGLRPKLFWILLGAVIVVVAASVAGGVGASLASRSRNENNAAQASATPVAAGKSSSATATNPPGGTAAADGGKTTGGSVNSAEVSSTEGTGTGTKTLSTEKGKGKPTDTNTNADKSTSSPGEKTVTTGGTTVVKTTTKAGPTTTQQQDPDTATTTTTKAAPPPTTTSKTTAAPAPAPTFLNNQTYTGTGFAFQAFAGSDYMGAVSDVIRDEGFLDLSFSSNSYVWLPNGADCCITFCKDDSTSVGWWCNERRQKDSSSAFPRVWIGCGSAAHKEHACS